MNKPKNGQKWVIIRLEKVQNRGYILSAARVAELADAPDLGSGSSECGFDSHPVYHFRLYLCIVANHICLPLSYVVVRWPAPAVPSSNLRVYFVILFHGLTSVSFFVLRLNCAAVLPEKSGQTGKKQPTNITVFFKSVFLLSFELVKQRGRYSLNRQKKFQAYKLWKGKDRSWIN